MASKFSLIINSDQVDGFKMNATWENEKEMREISEMIKLLIGKITKIEVKVTNSGEY